MNIVLFGFKCSGKTTCGSLAAYQLNKTFIDIDQVIEALYYDPLAGRPQKLSCRDIYLSMGEKHFRILEREAVRKARLVKEGIIATGGGSILDFFNYVELKRLGVLVYLKADREVIRERILGLPDPPAYFNVADIEGSFDQIYQGRIETYERVADKVLDTENLTIEQVGEAIINIYREVNPFNNPGH